MGPLQVVDDGVAVLGGGAGAGGGRPGRLRLLIPGDGGGAAVIVEGHRGHAVGGIARRQVVDACGGGVAWPQGLPGEGAEAGVGVGCRLGAIGQREPFSPATGVAVLERIDHRLGDDVGVGKDAGGGLLGLVCAAGIGYGELGLVGIVGQPFAISDQTAEAQHRELVARVQGVVETNIDVIVRRAQGKAGEVVGLGRTVGGQGQGARQILRDGRNRGWGDDVVGANAIEQTLICLTRAVPAAGWVVEIGGLGT